MKATATLMVLSRLSVGEEFAQFRELRRKVLGRLGNERRAVDRHTCGRFLTVNAFGTYCSQCGMVAYVEHEECDE